MATDSDPRRLRATAVSAAELKDALNAIPGKVVRFLDACHAGAFADKPYRELTRDCRVVMSCSSCADEESKQRAALKAGLFTEADLEGLAGKAARDRDGILTAEELFDYLRKRVKQSQR